MYAGKWTFTTLQPVLSMYLNNCATKGCVKRALSEGGCCFFICIQFTPQIMYSTLRGKFLSQHKRAKLPVFIHYCQNFHTTEDHGGVRFVCTCAIHKLVSLHQVVADRLTHILWWFI